MTASEESRFWGVTTLIGGLNKGRGLEIWQQGLIADCALDEREKLNQLADVDRASARRWLMGAVNRPERGKLPAAAFGSAIHKAIEDWVLSPDGSRPDAVTMEVQEGWNGPVKHVDVTEDAQGHLDAVERWFDRWEPDVEASEMVIFNDQLKYAGTLDMIAEVGGRKILIDFKTKQDDRDSKGRPRMPSVPEACLQLAAYRHATHAVPHRDPRHVFANGRRYYLVEGDERDASVPMPEVEGGAIVLITPKEARTYPIPCGPDWFHRFRLAAAAFQITAMTPAQVLDGTWEDAVERRAPKRPTRRSAA